MTTNYTPLSLSRLIHECVPSVETGMWHYFVPADAKADIAFRGENIIADDLQGFSYSGAGTHYTIKRRYEIEDLVREKYRCPAYRLDDVLRAVQVWGEKKGWEKELSICCGCGVSCKNSEITSYGKHKGLYDGREYTGCDSDVIIYHGGRVEVESTKLLTAWFADGLQFGTESGRVIKDIFTV